MDFTRSPTLEKRKVLGVIQPTADSRPNMSVTPTASSNTTGYSRETPLRVSFSGEDAAPTPETTVLPEIEQNALKQLKQFGIADGCEDGLTGKYYMFETPPKTPKPKQINPRKRLILTTPGSSQASSSKSTGAKKRRTNNPPGVDLPLPLEHRLAALTTKQMVNMIRVLVRESPPQLCSKIENLCPDPDLSEMETTLQDLIRKISRAIPHHRLGSSTDPFTYRHAAPHIINFRKEVLRQSKVLLEAEYWQLSVGYTLTALDYVVKMPVWDCPSHNDERTECLTTLSNHCMVAVNKLNMDDDARHDIIKRLETAGEAGCEVRRPILDVSF